MAFALALIQPPDDAEQSEPAAEQPEIVAPEPSPAPETVPGFPPNVRIDDETTWADLSVEQKDELRAIRASRRAEQLAPSRAAEAEEHARATSTRSAVREAMGAPRRQDHARDSEWNARERKLVNTTIGLGVATGVVFVVDMILVGVAASRVDRCGDAADDSCVRGLRDNIRLAVPIYAMSTLSGAGLVGTIVSGSLLGAHRNSRFQR